MYTLLSYANGNGKLPLRTCPGCSVPEPYRSPDWALVPVQTGPMAEYKLLLFTKMANINSETKISDSLVGKIRSWTTLLIHACDVK